MPRSGPEIDHEFKFSRRLNRHIGRLFTLKDAIDVACRAANLVDRIGAIRDQTAVDHKVSAEPRGVVSALLLEMDIRLHVWNVH